MPLPPYVRLEPHVHCVPLGACIVLTGVSSATLEITSTSQNLPAASLCQRAVPPQVRLASSPCVAGWKCPETNTPQCPSANASGEHDTRAPSSSGRVILTEFPCGVEVQLLGVELVF